MSSLHADIVGHRSGAEVTFTGVVVSDPTNSDGHERMLVLDQLGDTLELDYNTSLGRSVPVHAGQSVVVHGQPRRMTIETRAPPWGSGLSPEGQN